MDKTILADKAIKGETSKREVSTIMKRSTRNAITDSAERKLRETKKDGWTKL